MYYFFCACYYTYTCSFIPTLQQTDSVNGCLPLHMSNINNTNLNFSGLFGIICFSELCRKDPRRCERTTPCTRNPNPPKSVNPKFPKNLQFCSLSQLKEFKLRNKTRFFFALFLIEKNLRNWKCTNTSDLAILHAEVS